jgi:hypothetical protein
MPEFGRRSASPMLHGRGATGSSICSGLRSPPVQRAREACCGLVDYSPNGTTALWSRGAGVNSFLPAFTGRVRGACELRSFPCEIRA